MDANWEPPDGLPDGLYILTNYMSRTTLDLYGGSTVGGARCTGFPRNPDGIIDHQLWKLERDTSSETYTLRNLRGGTYLDLLAGNSQNGTQVTGWPRTLIHPQRGNQEWRIIEQAPDRYTIQCVRTNTYLEIAGGNPASNTNATCSARVTNGNHQLWSVDRMSRTSREIKDILTSSWKPDIINRLFQPYGDDSEYLILFPDVLNAIWATAKLKDQVVRKHVFDYDDFVIKSKDAVSSWARDRFRIDDYAVLFGIVYGNAKRGPKAYNWYLSSDMYDVKFFDAQTGREYTPGAMRAFGFEPFFATF